MSQRPRHWRVGVVLEPNRFADEHLSGVYQQLKPVEAGGKAALTRAQARAAGNRAVKPGAKR
jgi:hypothetical protein